MSKAWISDRWVKDARAVLEDGSASRLPPTAAQLRNISKLPEHFRAARYGIGNRWQVNWLQDGKQRGKTFKTRAEAEAYLAELEDDIRSSRYIDPDKSKTPYGQLAKKWITTKHDIKESTLLNYLATLNNRILPRWQNTPINTITAEQITEWITQLLKGTAPSNSDNKNHNKPLSPATVRKILKVTNQIFEYAIQHKYIYQNPQQYIAAPKSQPKETDKIITLTPKEIDTLAQECAKIARNQQAATLVLLLAYTGIRINEALAIQTQDINLEDKRITIRRSWSAAKGHRRKLSTPKNHKGRKIPIPNFLIEPIRKQLKPKPDTPLFRATNGKAVDHKNFYNRVWVPACENLNMEMRIHDLRHVAASQAIKAGADVLVVQRMLGHADATETLNTYAHLFPDRLDEVMNAVEQARNNHIANQQQ